MALGPAVVRICERAERMSELLVKEKGVLSKFLL